MKNNALQLFSRVKSLSLAHPWWSALIALVVLYGGYTLYASLVNTTQETKYVTMKVTKDTIVASVSGTGQVAASSQVEVKPKASGDITFVAVKNGQKVKAGQLIASLDATDAQKAVRDAQVNLQSAKLSLQKLTAKADDLSMAQAQNSLTQAQSSLAQGYDDGYNAVSSTFLDLPNVMNNLNTVLYGNTLSQNQDNHSYYSDLVKENDPTVLSFENDMLTKYKAAKDSYDATLTSYKTSSRQSSNDDIFALMQKTYTTSKKIADATKAANDFLNFVSNNLNDRKKPAPQALTTHLSTLNTIIGSTNSHLVSLLSEINTITNSKQTINEKTLSLQKLEGGADPLDVDSSQLSVKQRENALLDAQQNLADYYVRAPFSGTIAKLTAQKGDSAGSGTSLATLITDRMVASLSLNEVDAVKVKIGQKATLTFDAVPDLTIAGTVVEIDTVGTVSQGVVTYTVKIGFDSGDDSVRPGMSVSAAIITGIAADALVVPASAVKTRGENSYVEVFDPPLVGSESATGTPSTIAPKQVPVTVGISDDTSTEIVSGLKEGDQVVTRTIAGTNTTTSTTRTTTTSGGTRAGAGGAGFLLGGGGPR